MLPADLPTDLPSFQARFGTDEQCRDYLFEARWPDGFRCTGCGHADAYRHKKRLIDECVACGKQHSLLAGTIFEQTKTGLARWFLAVYLVTSSWTCPERMEGWDQNVTRPRACRSSPCRHALRPGCDSPGPSASAAGCTTRRQNTHGTTAVGDREVAYAWHPWAGRIVRVHEVITRASGAVLRCSPVGERVTRSREVPAWMLDHAACGGMRRVPHPVVELGALAALRALLSEVVAARVAAGESRSPAVASPDQDRGERHGATPPPPGPGTGSAAPPSPPAAPIGARRDAGLGLAAAGYAAHADRPDDAPAGRARRRRGARPAGPRR